MNQKFLYLLVVLYLVGCSTSGHLQDLDVEYTNPYDRPIDQISLMSNASGLVIVADLAREPYVEPGKSGLFFAVLDQEIYQEFQEHGFRIVNVRMR